MAAFGAIILAFADNFDRYQSFGVWDLENGGGDDRGETSEERKATLAVRCRRDSEFVGRRLWRVISTLRCRVDFITRLRDVAGVRFQGPKAGAWCGAGLRCTCNRRINAHPAAAQKSVLRG